LSHRAATEPAASCSGVEPGNHATGRLDLQHGRSLNEGLASPCANLKAMLQVTLILGQGDRGGVCRDIQDVHICLVGAVGSIWPSVDTASDATGFC
jgi:hypothetical protein